jgi:hypothetical protein
MVLDEDELLASCIHYFTLGDKDPWDSLDRKLDRIQTKVKRVKK